MNEINLADLTDRAIQTHQHFGWERSGVHHTLTLRGESTYVVQSFDLRTGRSLSRQSFRDFAAAKQSIESALEQRPIGSMSGVGTKGIGKGVPIAITEGPLGWRVSIGGVGSGTYGSREGAIGALGHLKVRWQK